MHGLWQDNRQTETNTSKHANAPEHTHNRQIELTMSMDNVEFINKRTSATVTRAIYAIAVWLSFTILSVGYLVRKIINGCGLQYRAGGGGEASLFSVCFVAFAKYFEGILYTHTHSRWVNMFTLQTKRELTQQQKQRKTAAAATVKHKQTITIIADNGVCHFKMYTIITPEVSHFYVDSSEHLTQCVCEK